MRQQVCLDSSQLVLQTPDTALLNSFRTDKDFVYLNEVNQEALTWWQILQLWIRRIISRIFSNEGITPYLRYFIFILIFLYGIYRLTGGRFQGIFAGKEGILPGVESLDYQIRKERLEDAIEKEVQEGKYRNAIRLMYIQILLDMEGKKLIRIRKDKTGRDYLLDLENHPVYPCFKEINRAFEYAWYGEFDPDREGFDSIRHSFEKAKVQLG